MDFKFSFEIDNEKSSTHCNCSSDNLDENAVNGTRNSLLATKEIDITQKELNRHTAQEICLSNGDCLKYISLNDLEEESSLVTETEQSHTDLIPGVYEGGMKIWECSIDLTEYLASLSIAFRGLKVLELGCGAGLPGLYAMIKGADVHFQDFNRDVIEVVTIPNILLNTPAEKANGRFRVFAGDWGQLDDLLANGENIYDIILTSETIYSMQSHQKLHDAIKVLLKRNGITYIAAKSHYFGVGGGTKLFEECVRKNDIFDIVMCKIIEDGVQREIFSMHFKKS